jgi:hypothetical protein
MKMKMKMENKVDEKRQEFHSLLTRVVKAYQLLKVS